MMGPKFYRFFKINELFVVRKNFCGNVTLHLY